MTINLTVPQNMQELRPRITVVGVGGAGCNAVNNMINADLEGVEATECLRYTWEMPCTEGQGYSRQTSDAITC